MILVNPCETDRDIGCPCQPTLDGDPPDGSNGQLIALGAQNSRGEIMGASVSAYWPGISDDQVDSQPGFFNDCKAWGNWMANREEHADVTEAMRRLQVAALCTFKTDGVDDADVEWAAPSELERAALRLRELVLAGHPDTKRILEVYARSANGIDPVDEEFARDLADVAELARFAAQAGASRMTLEVNW